MLVPCDTEYPAFVSERTIKETVGNIDCESCVKYVQYLQPHKHAHRHTYIGQLGSAENSSVYYNESDIFIYLFNM